MTAWNVAIACWLLGGFLVSTVRAADAPSVRTGTITVLTKGYPDNRGKALVQLANSADDYGSDGSGYRGARVSVQEKQATAIFADVPFGEYAVKVFHDANENEKLDMGLMGPKEAYGFSNNARGRFGPPSYADAKFVLFQEELTIEIEVK